MAYLQIKSNNPNLSFILQKNPASGMSAKQLRKGTVFGWYSENAYNIYFKDAENDVSYKAHQNEDFEHLNLTRFNSPLFIINAITEFCQHIVNKDPSEYDAKGFENSVTINQVYVRKNKYIDVFQKAFPEFELIAEETNRKNYRITIKTKNTLKELLAYTNLFAIFNVAASGIYMDAKFPFEKYLNCLNIVNAPYFMRYVFKVNFLQNKKQFEQYKDVLVGDCGAEMVHGTNDMIRKNIIEDLLDFSNPITDIGCGEGQYLFKFCKNVEDYIGVDIDEELVEAVQNKIDKRKIENAVCKATWCQEDVKGRDVLLVEVIEHMPIHEALQLMSDIMEAKPKKLIVTTPNADFNKYYFLDEKEMRHDDHKFEMNKRDFTNYEKWFKLQGYEPKFFDLGDSIEGVSCTQGVVLEKINES